MKYMILKVFADGSKENLYPAENGELPTQFDSFEAVEEKRQRLIKLFGDWFETTTMEKALEHPIPKRS